MPSLFPVSRRAFLRLSTMFPATVGVGRWPSLKSTDEPPGLARTFGLTPLYDRPDLSSLTSRSLGPYSVHMVEPVSAPPGWYRTEHGYVPRFAMQPISAYAPPVIETHNAAPFWAEVIAPVSTSRAWCWVKAPLVVTWGHGAVTQILGTLTDDYGVVWYETGSGWFDARQWQRVVIPAAAGPGSQIRGISVRIDPGQHELAIWHKERLLWRTVYYGGSGITDALTMLVQIDTPGDGFGTAWLMHLANGVAVGGAWDHNCFGLPGGPEKIELPIAAAKRLYSQIAAYGFEAKS